MSQIADDLLTNVRQLRHNYYKYSIYHSRHLRNKVLFNLSRINNLSAQLAKEVIQANFVSEHKDLMMELDELLRIATQKQTR